MGLSLAYARGCLRGRRFGKLPIFESRVAGTTSLGTQRGIATGPVVDQWDPLSRKLLFGEGRRRNKTLVSKLLGRPLWNNDLRLKVVHLDAVDRQVSSPIGSQNGGGAQMTEP